MSTEIENPESDANAPKAPAPRAQIETDESKLIAAYANFCRVMGTPEELIVDFGLNPQPMGNSPTSDGAVQRNSVFCRDFARLLRVFMVRSDPESRFRLPGLSGRSRSHITVTKAVFAGTVASAERNRRRWK